MINNKIFIQIASYRDPELNFTIDDAINKAKYPENLTFGICWQHSNDDNWDNLDKYKNDPRFKIIDIEWNKSKGLCWARSEIQKLWDGEYYTLQLDSHHRFIQDWDAELIQMMKLTGSDKPIIGSYAGQYSASSNTLLNYEPYKMVADNFTPYGTIIFRPHSIENWEKLDKPIPARFVSGHFFFTLGIHCQEYKYDPNLYFAGDEISLSIRSFTLGYDLFHPHKLVIWHEYTREGRRKHWTDFDVTNKDNGLVDKVWFEMDNESKRRLRHMLQEEDNGFDLGCYGLGTVRSHHDYELYAGIDFKRRLLHPNTLKGIDPPINDISDWYLLEHKEYNYELKIPKTDNFRFIYIGIEDKNGEVLYRKDCVEYEAVIKANFKSFTQPYKWIYWPVDLENNWINRIDTLL